MGASSYKLLLQANLDTKSLDAQIKSLQGKKITIGVTTNNEESKKALTIWEKVNETIKKGIISQLRYVAASALIVGSLREIGRGIDFIKQLNKEMTNIQIVTGMSNDSIKQLAIGYNQLAQEMGATTVEVAQGTLEWFRQGKTAQEAQQLVRASLMLSKLANMESAQATEYLTAILNGYRMEAEDAVSVIDKLVAVDNAAATSAAELSVALQRSSNSAQMAGVSFETLLAYVGTVSSVTRKSAESIGESFKTMFARLTNVKLTALDDTDSAINDVEKALAMANIQIRDGTTSFRDMEDVLMELSTKWQGLNEVEKSAISNAIAGIRQRENFLVLMNNFDEVLRLQKVQWISTGLAADRYAIYLENLEASSNKLTASWEGMWQATIDSKAVKFFMDLASSVMRFITAGGGLVPLLTSIIGLVVILYRTQLASFFLGLKNSVASLIPQLGAMIASLMGTTAAAGATTVAIGSLETVLGGIGIVLALVAAAFAVYSSVVKSAEERTAELNASIEQTKSRLAAIKDEMAAVKGLGATYNQLAGITSRSAQEQQEWYQVNNALHNLLPTLAGEYDNMGNFILDQIPTLEQLVDLKQQEYDNELNILRLEIAAGIDERTSAYSEYVAEMEKAIAKQKELAEWKPPPEGLPTLPELSVGGAAFPAQPYVFTDVAPSAEAVAEAELAVAKASAEVAAAARQMQIEYSILTEDKKPAYIAQLAMEMGITEDAARAILEYSYAVASVEPPTEAASYGTSDLVETMKSLTDEIDIINAVISKQQGGKLLYEDVIKLIEAHSDLIDVLEIVDGEVRLNEAAMNEHALALIDDTIAQEEQKGASEEYLAVLRAYRQELDNSVALSRDYATSLVNMTSATYQQMAANIANNATSKTNNELSMQTLENFKELGAQLVTNAQYFAAGKLTAEEYFQALNEDIANIDMDSIFGSDVQAGQMMFTGLVQQAAEGLNQLNSEWNAGNLLVSEYTDSMDDLAELFLNVGDMFSGVLDTMTEQGRTAQGVSSEFTSAMGQMQSSMESLRQAQELITLTDQNWNAVVQGNLQFNTDAYNQAMAQIANAYTASGYTFMDLNGQAYTSSAALLDYLAADVSNFGVFTDQVAQQAGGGIQGIVQAAGVMLQAIGEAISGFDATLSFTPEQVDTVPFKIELPQIFGKAIEIGVPQFKLNITGESSSMAGIGAAVSAFGAQLAKTKIDWDRTAFTAPTKMNQATGGMGKAADKAGKAFKQLQKDVGGVGGAGEEAKKSVKGLLDLVLDKIKQEKEAEKERLKAELDGYKKIIDKRKELLRSKREEEKYNQSIQKQTRTIANMEAELIELSLDDSEEAMARRMQLEEELAQAQEDLANDQADHSVDVQEEALDDDYERFEEFINDKIQVIEDFLSRPGEMMQEAIRIIEEKGATLYDDLMAWNKKYGSGIDADVTTAWNDAYEAMSQFKDELGKWDVQFTMNWEQGSSGQAEYHSGGFVGGLESNEEFAKLLKGEVVLTPEQMDNLISQFIPLPAQPSQMVGMGGASIGNFIGSIVVQGNMDSDVIPQLEQVINKAIDTLNKSMTTRGYQRRATDFSI